MQEVLQIVEEGINHIQFMAWFLIVLFIFCIVVTVVEYTTKTLHKEDDT